MPVSYFIKDVEKLRDKRQFEVQATCYFQLSCKTYYDGSCVAVGTVCCFSASVIIKL